MVCNAISHNEILRGPIRRDTRHAPLVPLSSKVYRQWEIVMKKPKAVLLGSALALAVAAALGTGSFLTQANSPFKPKAPTFQVVAWPKMPLPVAGQYGTPPAVSTSTG